MRNLLAAFFMQLLFLTAYGQHPNLVLNGSFETYTTCPGSGAGQINKCAGWDTWNSGSPDYYHLCGASVPSNWPGYQPAADGNAYAGIVDIWSNGGHREYLYSQMNPMQIGARYEVSMMVSASDKTRFGSNGFCIFFFDNGQSYYGSTQSIPAVTPQISFASYGPITDTANWVRLSASFIADSAYDNIVIGGFLSPTQATMDTFNVTAQYPSSYYYIDSVVVKRNDTFHLSMTDSMLCAGDTISVSYFTYEAYNSNNVFTAQLSNAAGSFNAPINIGSKTSDTTGVITGIIPVNISPGTGYRIRIISSSPADTTKNNSPALRIGNPDSTNISVSNNSPICEGNTLQFSAATFISGTSYSWAGPNNFSSASPNPFIAGAVPAQNGNYTVTMKWYGCEVKDTTQVTVKAAPATPVATNNGPLCAGETLNLSSTGSTSGVNYSWTGPGSYSSNAQNPAISNTTPAMSGNYIVTADLNGCSRKDTTTVLVKPIPAPVTLSNNSPICTGDTLKLFSTTSTTGVTYSWTGPNSFAVNTQDATIINATTAATGWYRITVDLNSCVYKDSTSAAVHPIPAMPNISYSNPLCLGETLNLGTSTVSAATYTWTGPGNFSSSLQNPARSNMQFGDTGTYRLTTTVNGCTSAEGTTKININPVPFVVIFPSPSDSICQGDPVNFTALPNNHGGTPAFQWYVNGQAKNTGTAFSSTTLNDQDIVRCDMTENTKCSVPYTDQSNDISMNVLSWLAPSVTISASPNRLLNVDEYVTFTATVTNGGNNPKFQWKRNGQDVVGATGNVWSANTLNDNDNVTVEIISDYMCPQPTTAASNAVTVRVLTGVGSVPAKYNLALYPNPNNGKFVLKGESSPNEKGLYRLEIINALGQIVYRDRIETTTIIYKEVQLPSVPAGMYVLRLLGDDGTSLLRFNVK